MRDKRGWMVTMDYVDILGIYFGFKFYIPNICLWALINPHCQVLTNISHFVKCLYITFLFLPTLFGKMLRASSKSFHKRFKGPHWRKCLFDSYVKEVKTLRGNSSLLAFMELPLQLNFILCQIKWKFFQILHPLIR